MSPMEYSVFHLIETGSLQKFKGCVAAPSQRLPFTQYGLHCTQHNSIQGQNHIKVLKKAETFSSIRSHSIITSFQHWYRSLSWLCWLRLWYEMRVCECAIWSHPNLFLFLYFDRWYLLEMYKYWIELWILSMTNFSALSFISQIVDHSRLLKDSGIIEAIKQEESTKS